MCATACKNDKKRHTLLIFFIPSKGLLDRLPYPQVILQMIIDSLINLLSIYAEMLTFSNTNRRSSPLLPKDGNLKAIGEKIIINITKVIIKGPDMVEKLCHLIYVYFALIKERPSQKKNQS